MTAEAAARNRQEILASVQRGLEKLPDTDIEGVKDAVSLGASMAAMVPRTAGEFGRIVGPLYTTKALTVMWNIGRAAISKRVAENKLLALKVEGDNLFPIFQFDGKMIRDDVMEIVQILRASVDPFTIAQWLRTPVLELDDQTPLDLLDVGNKAAAVRIAKRTAARWAM
ncbi:Protein of unknown function [Brevibacterium sandarakinum]|uniref:Uncharacterized protein n=1 Tax=Brevibacterium sandarakinum TaxID=629680 RepID=A0A1H1QE75_BRESA|nr:antitoxin Xre/MbcA/ParS toxin-binding domain-containing protein [Brevibacterium sandarakinum]SDS21750.1 Protein of unknown function [Brevibacterium sandarakinum]